MKVVEAKRLLESGKLPTIQDAVDAVGISRSSFTNIRMIFFRSTTVPREKSVTLSMQIEDEPGLLSDVLQVIAQFGANILTIHQSIPINGVAALSISVQVLQTTKDISEMLDAMEKRTGVHSVKILAKE